MDIEAEAKRLAGLEIKKKSLEIEIEIERKRLELVRLLLEQREAAQALEKLGEGKN